MVAIIIQVQIDIVIVQIIESDALLFIPSKHGGSRIDIIVVRESAVRPMSGMVGLERLPDFGAFLGLEFFRTSQSSVLNGIFHD
jgi:hypothetical protein